MKINAYAKINLYLSVIQKEKNGYHNVETVMQAISLHDEVTVTKENNRIITLTCSDHSLESKDNLASRAAELFRQFSGITDGLTIYIEKMIPISGGLAGGSTDAAATLLALNKIFHDPLSFDHLLSIGAQLGADIPFCILANAGIPSAFATHYGELVQPCPALPACFVLIASAKESVSTPWAYAESDKYPFDKKNKVNEILAALSSGDLSVILSHTYNRFETFVPAFCPKTKSLISLLKSTDASCIRMSGSGPSIAAFYTGDHARENASLSKQRCESAGYAAFLCTPLQNQGDRQNEL